MNSRNLNIKGVFLFLFSVLVLLTACEPDEELVGPDRLFRPTLKGQMRSLGNWLEVSWQRNKGAESYKVEISRDTFKTIDVSAQVDTNYYRFDNLEWDQLYQVRVQAFAADPAKNSGIANLGEYKTAKFPTILSPVTSNDITDVAAIVRWTNTGARATTLKLYKANDRENVLKEIELTDEDIENQVKRITGLTGATPYVVYAYSGETLRGWEYFTTKAPLVFATGSNIVDLRGITGDPAILQQTLQGGLPAGSVIILERGETYTISSTPVVSGSLTIVSGLGFGPVAKIKFSSNFDFEAGSNVDSLKFSDLSMRGDFGGGYVMNVDRQATVGKVIFQGCEMKSFRGVYRIKATAPVLISNFIYNNCVIDSINGYGVLNIDNAAATIENIKILNSTISRVQNVLVSKSNSNSVLIENCTFNEAPLAGNYFVNYNSNEVANGIRINNNILGIGWAKAGDPSTAVRGVRTGPNTTVSVMGTYHTSDYSVISNPLPELIAYTKEHSYLFKDPANGNFTIADLTFAGRNTAGDPRWRP